MSFKGFKILIVDDERHQRTMLNDFLVSLGYPTATASSGAEAFQLIEKADSEIRAVITDLAMPGLTGIDLVKRGKAAHPDLDFIVVTGHGTVETAVQALKAGAFDFLLKPLELDDLAIKLKKLVRIRALENRVNQVEKENRTLRGGDTEPVAVSPKMKKLMADLDQATQTQATVLLTGETGVGKEVLARYLHEKGPRAREPFVAVNCAAIPESLIESELFGHEKGAFTGADSRSVGLFERADGGTLFLDEIGEMDLRLQPKLLRAIEERKIRRLGGTADIAIDIRLITATHRDLKSQVSTGKFREDLFYRLNVVQLRIPPLRERMEDLPELVGSFVRRFAKNLGVSPKQVDSTFIEALRGYRFPGNIRELANLVERAMIYSSSGSITAEHLPALQEPSPSDLPAGEPGKSLADQVAGFEKRLIEQALAAHSGDVDRVALELGVSRSTLYSKISKYQLKP